MAKKSRGGSKKGVSERVEDWDVKESTVERLLDLLVALIIMCVILSWSLVTLSVQQHILTIILIPMLVYFTLSFSGMRLRLRERRSWLVVTDAIAIINIVLLTFYMDSVYVNQEPDWVYKMAFAVVSIVVLLLYITRVKFMYYLTVPAVLVINALLWWLWGLDMELVILISLLLPLPFTAFIVRHPFYFGIGRVRVNNQYKQCPEAYAKRYRARQKAERDAEDRRIREEERSMKEGRKSSRKKA